MTEMEFYQWLTDGEPLRDLQQLRRLYRHYRTIMEIYV